MSALSERDWLHAYYGGEKEPRDSASYFSFLEVDTDSWDEESGSFVGFKVGFSITVGNQTVEIFDSPGWNTGTYEEDSETWELTDPLRKLRDACDRLIGEIEKQVKPK